GLVLAGPAAGPRIRVGAALDGAGKTADRAVAAGGERMRRQAVPGGIAAKIGGRKTGKRLRLEPGLDQADGRDIGALAAMEALAPRDHHLIAAERPLERQGLADVAAEIRG